MIRKNQFILIGKWWYALHFEKDIKTIQPLKDFKSSLKLYLVMNSFYSFEEFMDLFPTKKTHKNPLLDNSSSMTILFNKDNSWWQYFKFVLV